jgi:hypothetical protein
MLARKNFVLAIVVIAVFAGTWSMLGTAGAQMQSVPTSPG